MNPTRAIYTRVKPDWHKLKTAQGLFFGYSRAEVLAKAEAARRAASQPRAVPA